MSETTPIYDRLKFQHNLFFLSADLIDMPIIIEQLEPRPGEMLRMLSYYSHTVIQPPIIFPAVIDLP